MNLLALDLGTSTGWALLEDGRIESGVETFAVKRGESPGMRYVHFNRWLDHIAPAAAPGRTLGLVVYEQFHQRGGAATEIAAGLATRVQEFCARHGIEHAAVHTATLKKWTTGRGGASKTEMLEACARRWRRVDSDDEADAIALLHYARAELVAVQDGAHGHAH